MSELVFNVTQEEDGGYWTRAEGESIFTQGNTWEELRHNVQEAVEAHFGATGQPKPQKIRIHLVRDEELLVA